MTAHPNYITPDGFSKLRAEYDQLLGVERPRVVEIVSWAAGNGDRSENGDYLYGRKRMREIDGQLRRLSKKMKDAKVVDPRQQPDKNKVFFGATVTIVGNDEADASAGRIGWGSPIARALRGAAIGDLRRVLLPAGEKEYEVMAISYPA
jgi:transcription elongation factor GreB